MSYIADLASARKAATETSMKLATALKHVEPISPEMHALFITKPESYAECLRKVADILITIPSLREAANSAKEILAELEILACYRCNGTGQYGGPTRATRNGVPYCFKCDGKGTTKS